MPEPFVSRLGIVFRLSCATCANWEATALRALPDGEAMGHCTRFGEARRGSTRPRCKICWEPVTALHLLTPAAPPPVHE